MSKKAPAYLDRLQHQDGRKGTIISVHGPNATVMLDNVRRDLGAYNLWVIESCTWMAPSYHCPNCGQPHKIMYCPENAPPPRDGPANLPLDERPKKPELVDWDDWTD